MDAVRRHLLVILIFLIAGEAYTQDTDPDCVNVNGVCQNPGTPCDKGYVADRCIGSADLRCCLEATCTIHGDPHCSTTDNKNYTFGGNCSYYLLSDSSFNITADFRACTRRHHVSCLWSVKVTCEDGNIVVAYRTGDVTVNHNRVPFPYQSDDGNVWVYKLPPDIIIEMKCNGYILILKWLPRRVTIMVPYQLFNSTSGLCGNYDNNPDNDFLTPEGELVSDVNVFGNSWVVPDSC